MNVRNTKRLTLSLQDLYISLEQISGCVHYKILALTRKICGILSKKSQKLPLFKYY